MGRIFQIEISMLHKPENARMTGSSTIQYNSTEKVYSKVKHVPFQLQANTQIVMDNTNVMLEYHNLRHTSQYGSTIDIHQATGNKNTLKQTKLNPIPENACMLFVHFTA